MASAHIEITGSGSHLNRDLRAFVDALQAVQNMGRELKATADQCAQGEDWVGMQAAFALANTTDAETIYNLLGSVNTTLTTDAFILQILSRLG